MALLNGGLRAAVLLACASCAPKPLRFEDASSDGEDRATISVVDASDAALLSDADVIATDVADGSMADAQAVDDVVAASDASEDAAIGRDASATRPSCAAEPTREDCRVVEIVPERSFCVGVAADAFNSTWNASPPVCGLSLSRFAVDAYEVSVARFRVFYERWAARGLPAYIDAAFANGLVFRAPQPPRTLTSEWNPSYVNCTWTDAAMPGREQHPINCVGWALAMYFCAWEGGHLLTSTQYEYLARWHADASGAGRSYAWGESAPDCTRTHFGRCMGDDALGTRRVGSLASGAVATVFDLSGNVADWVADDFALYPALEASSCWTRSRRDPLCLPTINGDHYARGSNYSNPTDNILRTVFRPGSSTSEAIPGRGFRCAYLR